MFDSIYYIEDISDISNVQFLYDNMSIYTRTRIESFFKDIGCDGIDISSDSDHHYIRLVYSDTDIKVKSFSDSVSSHRTVLVDYFLRPECDDIMQHYYLTSMTVLIDDDYYIELSISREFGDDEDMFYNTYADAMVDVIDVMRCGDKLMYNTVIDSTVILEKVGSERIRPRQSEIDTSGTASFARYNIYPQWRCTGDIDWMIYVNDEFDNVYYDSITAAIKTIISKSLSDITINVYNKNSDFEYCIVKSWRGNIE